MIEMENVSFSYDGDMEGGLKKISLSIKEGEFVLLCGRSGCGKTTILRTINGLIPDYFDGELEGRITYQGLDISEMKMYERSRLIGSVFQNPRTQFFNVDTDSEITFGMENLGLERQDMLEKLEETTEKLNIQKLRGRSIFKLSGGEKQQIAFASVYAMNPQVYLLDEPSSNLDSLAIEELRKQLQVIKKAGKTVLISEHRIYYLMDLVDRIVYMDGGQICGSYSKEEFLALTPEKRRSMGLRSAEKLDFENESTLITKQKVLLEAADLSIQRGSNVLQSHINLKLAVGDVVGIIGPNGVGKTSLVRTLCGLQKDYQGKILLDGKEASAKQLNQACYMVMQDVNYQLFAESVKAECHLGLKNVDEKKVEQSLEDLGLSQFGMRHPNTLSGGQKQRLSVAVAQICQKKILVFDEPTSGLDYDSMIKVAETIRNLAKEAAILVITHDVEFANSCCTDWLELKKGEINERRRKEKIEGEKGKSNRSAFKVGWER